MTTVPGRVTVHEVCEKCWSTAHNMWSFYRCQSTDGTGVLKRQSSKNARNSSHAKHKIFSKHCFRGVQLHAPASVSCQGSKSLQQLPGNWPHINEASLLIRNNHKTYQANVMREAKGSENGCLVAYPTELFRVDVHYGRTWHQCCRN